MLSVVFYLNSETDETTKSLRIASRWLKAGSDVEVWILGNFSGVLESGADV